MLGITGLTFTLRFGCIHIDRRRWACPNPMIWVAIILQIVTIANGVGGVMARVVAILLSLGWGPECRIHCVITFAILNWLFKPPQPPRKRKRQRLKKLVPVLMR